MKQRSSRRARNSRRRELKDWCVALGVSGVSAVWGGLACDSRLEAEPESSISRVVLISVDTLRADHLGCYGYSRNTTPHIDALSRHATRFANAVSSSPWTLPSHASLFTGLHPHEHAAISLAEGGERGNARPLADAHRTLAEALRDRGFSTGAFVANVAHLGRRYKLDQGFQDYELQRRVGVKLNTSIVDWIDRHRDDSFFLFVNYMDTHRPYNTAPIAGLLQEPLDRDRQLLDRLIDQVMGEGREPDPDLVRRVIDQYDTAVANADRAVGELIAHLETLGIYEDALVVVTSDHGEYFGEHGLVEHGKDVYQAALRVPLLVKAPRQRVADVVEEPISSAHVLGLIARALPEDTRVAIEAEFPQSRGSEEVISENYYARAKDLEHPVWGDRFNRVRRALYRWPYKYIESSNAEDELYDLRTDAEERANQIESNPERAAELSVALRTQVERGEGRVPAPESLPPPLTPEEREALRSLGYIE